MHIATSADGHPARIPMIDRLQPGPDIGNYPPKNKDTTRNAFIRSVDWQNYSLPARLIPSAMQFHYGIRSSAPVVIPF